MKKNLVWILVVMLVVLSFVGCGKKEEASTDSEAITDSEVTKEQPKSKDENVELEKLSKKDSNTLEKLVNKEKELGSYSYKMTAELVDGMLSEVTVYKSEDWMRMESQMEGFPKTIMLFNVAEGIVYNIDENLKQVIMIKGPELFVDPTSSIDMMLEEAVVPEGTELDKVDYKGKKALLLSVTMKDVESGKDIGTKIWYDEDKGVPLAYELLLGEESMLTEFEYDFTKVSEDLFELPADYPIIDMGNLDEIYGDFEVDMEEDDDQ